MRNTWVSIVLGTTFVLGCGSSYPPPTQPLADVQASQRSAQELGATNVPEAQLHLQLAKEEENRARTLMRDDENERAAEVLKRAKADADLALALTHEHRAKAKLDETAKKSQATTTGGAEQ